MCCTLPADYFGNQKMLFRVFPILFLSKEKFQCIHICVLGMWKAGKEVLNVPVRGCNFHWQQALMKKVAELGLKRDYEQKEDMYKYIRKLMALPYLPVEHITPSFHTLKAKASSDSLIELCNYINDVWLTSTIYPVDSWCQFMQPIRTNNDVEGWHRGLNSACSNNAPPFYILVNLLYDSVKSLPLQLRMLSHGKLVRKQRKRYRGLQGKIFDLWEKYNEHQVTTSKLLKAISFLI